MSGIIIHTRWLMKYCVECGNELIEKECGIDGIVPYCPVCKDFRFPTFNSAVSSVIFNPTKDKILLIQQYGRTSNILVAGYINKGENANEALLREVQEEVNLQVKKFEYNDNVYFDKSNTLIHNFISTVSSEDFVLTDEVDKATWFPIEEAIHAVKEKSLAKNFLFKALHKMGMSEFLFHIEEECIYVLDSEDNRVAQIDFPFIEGAYTFNHTFVDESMRGSGIALKLIQKACAIIENKHAKAKATCSYAVSYFEKNKDKHQSIL